MNKIAAYAPLLEKIFLAGLLIGVVLTLLHAAPLDTTVTVVSLYGLGAAYYFSAFQRFEIPSNESQPSGFKELLGFGIVPKVLWISSAVSVIGLAIFVMDTQHKGHEKMALIGGLAMVSGLAVMLVLLISGVNTLKPLPPVLLRAIPLLLADVYILTR